MRTREGDYGSRYQRPDEYVSCKSPEGIRRLKKAAGNGNIKAANKLIELALSL